MTTPLGRAAMRAAHRAAVSGRVVVVTPAAVDAIASAVVVADTPGVVATEAPQYAVTGSITGRIDDNTGRLDARLEGSPVVASWQSAFSTSSMPSNATVNAAGAVNTRAVDLPALAVLALGGKGYLKARCFTAASATGAPSGYLEAVFRRDTPDLLTRTYHLTGAEFTPIDDLQQFDKYHLTGDWTAIPTPSFTSACWTGRGAVAAAGFAAVHLPVGATVTKLSAVVNALTGSDVADVRLYDLNAGNLTTAIVSLIATGGGGGQTLNSGTLATAVTGRPLLITVATTSAANGAAVVWEVTVTYTIPDHSKGV